MPRKKVVKKIDNAINYDLHLIIFGDHHFELPKKRLLKEAENSKWFKTIKGYSPQDLTENFKEKFKDILSRSRGAGYWIWKVDIIRQRFKEIEDNQFLIYLDAGCTINSKGHEKLKEYLEMLDNSPYGILSFQTGHIEKLWTTKEIFKFFDFDLESPEANNGQYVANVIIMQKNKHLDEYLSFMEKVLEENPLLFTDDYNDKQEEFFKDNRHDQSLSSVIRKKIGSVVIERDETFFSNFYKEGLKYPFWATRRR